MRRPLALLALAAPSAAVRWWRPAAPTAKGSLPPAAASALADAKLDDQWQFVLQQKGVSVWKACEKDEASSETQAPMAIKSSVEVGVPASYLTDLILTRDYDLARRFNPTLDGGEDLEWTDGKRERISYVRTKPVLFMRPRDFVLRVRREDTKDGVQLVTNTPATHGRAPPVSGCVRGSISGLHLVEPRGASTCQYTSVHQMDPAGTVPIFVVNWFALRRPLQYMVALRDLAEERHATDEEARAAEESTQATMMRPLRRARNALKRRIGRAPIA